MRVVVTRPQADSGAHRSRAVRARGHEVLVAPLMRVEPVAVQILPDTWSAIVITSANAPRHRAVPARSLTGQRLPLFAVGERSAEAARAKAGLPTSVPQMAMCGISADLSPHAPSARRLRCSISQARIAPPIFWRNCRHGGIEAEMRGRLPRCRRTAFRRS